MKKKTKHIKDMTNDEIISHVFHPDALKHIKKHIEDLSKEKKKPNKSDNK